MTNQILQSDTPPHQLDIFTNLVYNDISMLIKIIFAFRAVVFSVETATN